MLIFGLLALCSLGYGLYNKEVIGSKSNNYNDVYNVRLLPISLADEELDKLPPTSFSYLAMIDAGSSGCRVHVYRYGKLGNMDGPLYVLPKHVSLKAKPGLSTFASNAVKAGESLAPLVAFLKEKVPVEFWEVTPIWLKATAGLRMLSSADSEAILNDVREYLLDKNNSPFLFRPSYARIISGKEEGAFGWVAFNYLKRIIGPKKNQLVVSSNTPALTISTSNTPIVATTTPPTPYVVVEMGGASSQVTQRIPNTGNNNSKKSGNIRAGSSSTSTSSTKTPKTSQGTHSVIPLDNHFSFHIEDEFYELYTYSYLGYGSEQAREKLNNALLRELLEVKAGTKSSSVSSTSTGISTESNIDPGVILDVCLNNGYKRQKGTKRDSVYDGSDTIDYVIAGNAGNVDNGMGCYNAMAKFLKNHYISDKQDGNSNNLRADNAHSDGAMCKTSDGRTRNVIQPASFDCVHQPHFVVESSNFLVFENFFYSTSAANVLAYNHAPGLLSKDELTTGIQYPLLTSPLELKESAMEVCKLEYVSELLTRYPRDSQPKDVATKLCFTLSYAAAFLIEGLHVPENKVLTIQKEVEGSEIEWALGAAYKEASELLKPRPSRSS